MESIDAHKRSALRQLLRLWLRGVTELLLFAPMWLATAVYGFGTLGGQLLWLLHLPLLTLLGTALAHPIRRTWLRWAAAVPVGAAELLFMPAVWWQGALLAAAGCAAVLRGMAVTSSASRKTDAGRCGVGVAAYALCGLVCGRLPEWSDYMPWLTAGGVASLAIALFVWNRRLLQQETMSAVESAVPATVRGHNRLMVAAVFALAVGVTALASGAVGRLLWSLLRAALGLLAAAPSVPPAPPPQPAPRRQELPPPNETGWLERVLDILFYALGTVVIVAAVFLLVRALYRHRREIARRIARFFARLAALLGRTSRPAVDEGYVDEETALWSWELLESSVKRRWLHRFGREPGGADIRWSGLPNNRERVRYLYRQWLGRLRGAGYAAPRYLTPEEIRRAAAAWQATAADGGRRRPLRRPNQEEDMDAAALVELYYRARYGEGEIADAAIERLRRQSGRSSRP